MVEIHGKYLKASVRVNTVRHIKNIINKRL